MVDHEFVSIWLDVVEPDFLQHLNEDIHQGADDWSTHAIVEMYLSPLSDDRDDRMGHGPLAT